MLIQVRNLIDILKCRVGLAAVPIEQSAWGTVLKEQHLGCLADSSILAGPHDIRGTWQLLVVSQVVCVR